MTEKFSYHCFYFLVALATVGFSGCYERIVTPELTFKEDEVRQVRKMLEMPADDVDQLASKDVPFYMTPAPQFRINQIEIARQELAARLKDDEKILERFPEKNFEQLGSIMVALFGTPDQPTFPFQGGDDPYEFGDDAFFRELESTGEGEQSTESEGDAEENALTKAWKENLRRSANSVSSDEDGIAIGLYREHCVHCHGVSGDGMGPTAGVLNPYPRDFRMGVFKYKSTDLPAPPTRDDLMAILDHGIPGTGMPSFKLLPDEDKQALIDYVIYLSARGMVERALLREITEEIGPEIADKVKTNDEKNKLGYTLEVSEENKVDDLLNFANATEDAEKFEEDFFYVFEEIILGEVEYWASPDGAPESTPVPQRPASLELDHPDREKMIARGRELFLSKANCHTCHGNTGVGDGQDDKYDAWTEEWMTVVGDSEEKLEKMLSVGAFPPRKLSPRNLRHGVYRGGNKPIDLFRRVKNGIAGTPMPAAPPKFDDEHNIDDDVWCIVEYIRQLPRENAKMASSPEKPVNERKVN